MDPFVVIFGMNLAKNYMLFPEDGDRLFGAGASFPAKKGAKGPFFSKTIL
jgi:hypothetical protein